MTIRDELFPASWLYTWGFLEDEEKNTFFVSTFLVQAHFEKTRIRGLVPLAARWRQKPFVYSIETLESVVDRKFFFRETTNVFQKFAVSSSEHSDTFHLGNLSITLDHTNGKRVGVKSFFSGSKIYVEGESRVVQAIDMPHEGIPYQSFLYPQLRIEGNKDGKRLSGIGFAEHVRSAMIPADVAFRGCEWLHMTLHDGRVFIISTQESGWSFFSKGQGIFFDAHGRCQIVGPHDFVVQRIEKSKNIFEWRVQSELFAIDVIVRPMFEHGAIGAYALFGLRYWQGGCRVVSYDESKDIGVAFVGKAGDQPFFLKILRIISRLYTKRA